MFAVFADFFAGQPFILRMMEDAATYVRMEKERDQLRLKMDETARKYFWLGLTISLLHVRN